MDEQKQKTKCVVCGGEFVNIGSHMKAHDAQPPVKPENTATKPETPESKLEVPSSNVTDPVTIKKDRLVLINTSGEEVPQEDYFYNGVVPPGFVGTCGKAVDREDMLGVFNRVFKPSDNFLLYKALDKEVYIIIVPIKYSTTINSANNCLDGDFQKHAISFLNEGSVNLDTLKLKLDKILKFCKFDNR